MSRERQIAEIMNLHGAVFTSKNSQKALDDGLTMLEIRQLNFYILKNKSSLGQKSDYYDRAIQRLNDLNGDFRIYMLANSLKQHMSVYFEDETEKENELIDIINQSGCPDAVKNVILKRIKIEGYENAISNFTEFIDTNKRVDCYILAMKCAEKGKPLNNQQINFLKNQFMNKNIYTESVYDMLAAEFKKNGVRNTMLEFNQLLEETDVNIDLIAHFYEMENITMAEAVILARESSLDNTDTQTIEIDTDSDNEDTVAFLNPEDASKEDSVVILSRAPTKPPQKWVGASRSNSVESQNEDRKNNQFQSFEKPKQQGEVRQLPYLHKKINFAHLKDGKLLSAYAKKHEFNGESYSIYRDGVLGEGSFGEVVLAQNDRTGEWIALKRIKDPTADPNGIQHEINNLDKSKELVFHAEESGQVYIGMKLQKGMEVAELLEKPNLFQAQRLLIAKRMLKATVDIHFDTKTIIETTGVSGVDLENRKKNEYRIFHRDIKPENMMVDASLNVVHIDFGLAGNVSRTNQTVRDYAMGSPPYMAPELLDVNEVQYNEATEVFALGISMMKNFDLHREAIITDDKKIYYPKNGRFFSENEYQSLMQIPGAHFRYEMERNRQKIASFDPKLIDLINKMNNSTPENRPTLLEAYSEFNKIIARSVSNNQNNPEGLKAYAVSIEDFEKAKATGKMSQFIKGITGQGINSIAFYSTNTNVSDNTLIEAQRTFTNAGITHIAPDIYNNPSATVNLQQIEAYYNRTFGSVATQLNHSEALTSRSSQASEQDQSIIIHHSDLAKIIKDYSGNKNATIDFVKAVNNIPKIEDRQQALGQLLDQVIAAMNKSPTTFYKNGGKQLIQDILAQPNVGAILQQNNGKQSAKRGDLLKACVLPQLHQFIRSKFVDKVDGLVAKEAAKKSVEPSYSMTRANG